MPALQLGSRRKKKIPQKRYALHRPDTLPRGGRTGTEPRECRVRGAGEGALSTRSGETAARVPFSHNGSNAVPARGPRLRVRDPAWSPRTPQAGGNLDPGVRLGARPLAGVRGGADLARLQRPGRWPCSPLPSRPAGGAALTCLRARAMAATPPGKGRSAARRPGARRGEGRGARGTDWVLGPRPGGPGWMRRLPARQPVGQSRRCP